LRPDIWHELALARLEPEAGLDFEAAAADLKRALCLAPETGAPGAQRSADRWCDLARCQRSTRHPGHAVRSGRRALCLTPTHTSALIEVSAAFLQLDHITTSDLCARRAAIHSPTRAEPYANLAEGRYRRGAFSDALQLGRHADILAPRSAQILTNLASYHLAMGNLAQGWALFKNRPGRRSLLSRFGSHPAWNGGPYSVLRVLAEQGLGDELMFSTCWPDLVGYRQRGEISRIEIEVDPRLIDMARRSFPDLAFFPRDIERPEDFPLDLSAAMPSLPPNGVVTLAGDMAALLRPSLTHFPAKVAPLTVDRAKSEVWKRWLESKSSGRPRIGVCWRSGLRSEDRVRYYPDIRDLGAILRLNAYFVILQYDECSAEVAQAQDLFGTRMVFPPNLDRRDNLEEMAALIEELDLVVSADTAVLALAARMNTPCIGLVSHTTWVGLGTDGRPFLPSIEVMTRSTMSDGQPEGWTELSERAATRVASMLSDRAV
jgi:tetratricopeptide (TPR) repeat protein